MEPVTRVKLTVTVLAFFPAVAFAQFTTSMTPGTGMAGGPHDFSVNYTTNTGPVGMCTFCHALHRAQSTQLLWNHTLSANTFSWSDATTTIGGTVLPSISPTYRGASVKCLSCHDGSVAIGDIGWFKEGAGQGGSALSPERMGAGNLVGIAPSPANEFVVGSGGDLKGNHPIAIPFPWGNSPSTYNTRTTGSTVILTEFKADPQTLGIRLFNDPGTGQITAGAVAGKAGIECSSCHDPHNGVTVKDHFFLRGTMASNDSNYLCLKCHNK